MDGCIPNRNEVFSDEELAPCARIRKTYMPSITGVPECLKLRKRCRIRARIRRKLLRDDADLPPWFLAISTPMQSNSHTTDQLGAPPPRTQPANPLEWSRFEHQCLPPVTGQIVPAASPPPLSPAAALRQQARLLARPARPRLPHQRLRTAPSLRHLDRGQQGPHRFARCPS